MSRLQLKLPNEHNFFNLSTELLLDNVAHSSPYYTMRWVCVLVRFVSKNARKTFFSRRAIFSRFSCVFLAFFLAFFLRFFICIKTQGKIKNASETTHSVIIPSVGLGGSDLMIEPLSVKAVSMRVPVKSSIGNVVAYNA